MSMIRDLRAAVRPSLRKSNTPYNSYDATRDPSASSAVVDCAVYRDGRRVTEASCLTPREAMLRVREEGGFAWIGLHEPTEEEFAGIAREFGLHPLAVEDAVHAHQRPKLERYDDTLFTVFKTIHYVEHAELTATSEVVETGEVMCFTGRDFVITVRHGGQGSLRALRHRLQEDPELLAKGPSAVLHSIADHVVDGYIAVAAAVQDDIDEVEIDVFSTPAKGSRARVGRGPDLPAQARGAGVQARRVAAAAADAAAERAPDAADRPRHPEVLPGRGRPPGPGARGGHRLRRAAELDPPGQSGAGDRRAERGHAQDHLLGGDHRRADDDLRRVRHELQAHAGTRGGRTAIRWCSALIGVVCFSIHRSLKRNGWL